MQGHRFVKIIDTSKNHSSTLLVYGRPWPCLKERFS